MLVNFFALIPTMRLQSVTASGLSAPLVLLDITSIMIPKLYAVAAMWTLNSREDIRSAVANYPPTYLDLGTSAGGTSGPETARHLLTDKVEKTGSQSTMSSREPKNIKPILPQVWDV